MKKYKFRKYNKESPKLYEKEKSKSNHLLALLHLRCEYLRGGEKGSDFSNTCFSAFKTGLKVLFQIHPGLACQCIPRPSRPCLPGVCLHSGIDYGVRSTPHPG